MNLLCFPSNRLELNNLIEFIGRKYAIFAFELDGKIKVDELAKLIKNIAGRKPSSAQNHESVEYSITDFSRIKVGNINRNTGEILIQNSDKYFFKNAHNIITLGAILSYLTGNMPRRLMISLIKNSIK